jgi:hypothetical protein
MLCDRTVRKLTRHHLVPRTRHKNKRNKKMFDRREVHRTIDLCSSCHRHVHATISNKELEREYNTLEALKVHPGISRFVEWVRRKPQGTAGGELSAVRRAPRRKDEVSKQGGNVVLNPTLAGEPRA